MAAADGLCGGGGGGEEKKEAVEGEKGVNTKWAGHIPRNPSGSGSTTKRRKKRRNFSCIEWISLLVLYRMDFTACACCIAVALAGSMNGWVARRKDWVSSKIHTPAGERRQTVSWEDSSRIGRMAVGRTIRLEAEFKVLTSG